MPVHSTADRRWIPIALLFCATLLNYVDRQALSVLSATLRRELSLTERDYSHVVSAFLISYGVMYALGGRWVDRVGFRLGVAACVTWWSVAAALTSLVQGARSLIACRFLLGVGEPVIYPAGLKASAELFASSGRGLAMGVLSSGSSAGAIVAPPLIAAISLWFGWRAAFLIPGLLGLVLSIAWYRLVRPPAAAPAAPSTPMLSLLRRRDVWALVAPRLFSDPVWYFYLFWLPDYLQRERGLSLAEIGYYGWIPFVAADVGAIGGGAISDWLVRRGMDPRIARRRVLIAVAALAPLGALAAQVPSAGVAIALVAVAAAMTQVWAINIATLGADTLGPEQSASILGLMGAAGSLSGAVFSQVLASVIGAAGYPAAFLLAASMHPIAALLLFALGRRSAKP